MDGEKGYLLTRQTKKKSGWHHNRYAFTIASCLLLLAWNLTHRFVTVSCPNLTFYANEKLGWTPCGEIDGRRLECSRIDVPMDHFNESNSGDKTFDLAVIRLRGDDNAKHIWMNPGGPGASGLNFIRNRGRYFNNIIGSGYHFISVDSRGIGESRPEALCFPSKEVKQSLSISPFQPVDRSAEAYAWAADFARACDETSAEHGHYINTPQTAADMNTVLEAVGQKEMLYWGVSYGTILGRTYASMFPDRIYRMVIDAVVDDDVYYMDRIGLSDSFADTERVMYGFFDECIKAKDCPLSKFGNTTEELQSKVLDYAIQLIEEPLSVYVDNTHWGVLKYEHVVFTGIFGALYTPSTWWTVADTLAKLLDGDATAAFLSWAATIPNADLFEENQSFQFLSKNDGPTGVDHWPENRQEMLKAILPTLNMSIFAPVTHLDLYIRKHWSIPKTYTFKPRKSVKTAHPLLILNTKWDPVCPLISAKSARARFEGSEIVVTDGYGHCSFAAPSTCAGRYVRDYLDHGTVPEELVECAVDGEFFMKPE